MTKSTNTTKPRRVQRRRTKGYRTPPNTVYVGRPTKWGNVVRAVQRDDGTWWIESCDMGTVAIKKESKRDAKAGAVRLFRAYLENTGPAGGAKLVEMAKRELRGKNLSCFCEVGEPCHADVLLEVANGK